MELKIDDEFVNICQQIVDENRSLALWAEVESDDMYQTEHFAGGFDADEKEFCFSYYDEKNEEYWFQISLDSAQMIVDGKKQFIDNVRKVEP